MCPTSNIQTGAAESIAKHPLKLLRELHFRVTVNTDNRLMSQVTLTDEFASLVRGFGYGWPDLHWLTVNAMKSAFAPFDERLDLINTTLKPAFAELFGQEQRQPASGRRPTPSDCASCSSLSWPRLRAIATATSAAHRASARASWWLPRRTPNSNATSGSR